ncbi:skin secretory protein xP2-like [Pipra filicauda]|uniref:Skin secretory protein xP2-like n=1 Tax=Pipra filicauda TaxID=649802 RepID=A0A7R5KK27_9PASS|nr:skin secretory protein xP2-like [Pipra filicauda]
MDPGVAGPAAAAPLALRLPAEGERGAGGVSAGEAGAPGRAGRRRPRVHLGSPAPAAGPGTLCFAFLSLPFPSLPSPFPAPPARLGSARRSAGGTAPSPGPARTGGAAVGGGGRKGPCTCRGRVSHKHHYVLPKKLCEDLQPPVAEAAVGRDFAAPSREPAPLQNRSRGNLPPKTTFASSFPLLILSDDWS